jgi:hypothetical protein
MDATRDVLTSVGMAMPRTRFGVIVSLLWFRFMLRLRGLAFVPRDAKDAPASELLRVDVCWSVSCSLTYADPFLAALFLARHLLLALRARERLRIARALSIEGGFAAATGRAALPRAQRALALAREAASGSSDPYAGAIVTACEGIANVFELRFAPAIDLLERAIVVFRERCPGSRWEIATMRYYVFLAQFFACRFDTLGRELETALKEAVETGDRYAAVMLRSGTTNRNWILIGDPARARRELEAAKREWPTKPFHVVHYYALISGAYIELYEGNPERAEEILVSTRLAVRRSMILELEGPRLEYAGIQGRVALGLALAETMAGKRPEPRHLREVDRCVRLFEGLGGPVGSVAALSLRAGRAAVLGERDEALAYLDDVAREKAEEGWLGAQCARWFAARMRGPDASAEERAAAVELQSRGVKLSRSLIAGQLSGLERYWEERA